MKIVRRLDEAECIPASGHTCPAAFLLEDGDVALVGTRAPGSGVQGQPGQAGTGPGDALVTVPRHLLTALGWDVPEG